MATVARPHSPGRHVRLLAGFGAAAVAVAVATLFPSAGPATADTVTATVQVGRDPHGAAITPDGARTYVTSQNGGTGLVSVIDTATNTLAATVRIGGYPYEVAITPDGTRAYITNHGSNTVWVLNTATNTVTATVPVGAYPLGVAVTPNGARAYVTNQGSNTVSVIDTATNKVTATIPVGVYPDGVAVTPNGARAYVTNQTSGTVSVIDTAIGAVTATIPVGASPLGVAITPDGTHAYVTNAGSGTVSAIDTAIGAVTANIPVGAYPHDVAVTPNGARAYITNPASDTVSVIDTATNTPATAVPVGAPYGVAITPDSARAYITSADGNTVNTVSVIAIGQAPTLVGTPASGVVGQPYSYPFTVTGYPVPTVTVTAGTLPDGLTLTAGGVLSGTPTTGGRFEFTVTASNGIGQNAALPVVLEIDQVQTATVVSRPVAAQTGSPVNLFATVSPAPALGAGTMKFLVDGVDAGTTNVDSDGVAILPYTFTQAGTRNVVAQFSGTPGFEASTSPAFQVSVTTPPPPAKPTTTTVEILGTPIKGTQVTLRAAVTPAEATGTVQFKVGTTNVGAPVPVANGIATLAYTFPDAGAFGVTATFTGTGVYTDSSSAPVSVTISKPASNGSADSLFGS